MYSAASIAWSAPIVSPKVPSCLDPSFHLRYISSLVKLGHLPLNINTDGYLPLSSELFVSLFVICQGILFGLGSSNAISLSLRLFLLIGLLTVGRPYLPQSRTSCKESY